MEEQGSTPEALQQSLGLSSVMPVPQTREQRRVWARAMLAWLLFTVAGWVSIPEPLRFVDQSTALAWMMHVAGFTLFLVLVTRQMRWLPVNFALGLTVLWVMSMVRHAVMPFRCVCQRVGTGRLARVARHTHDVRPPYHR